jgi:hypothetical protein
MERIEQGMASIVTLYLLNGMYGLYIDIARLMKLIGYIDALR